MAWFTHTKRGRWSWVPILGLTLSLAIAGCGTASGAATASPTTTTPPTPIPTIAPTPTPQPRLADPLTSNTRGWPVSRGHCEFANGGLQVKAAVCVLPNYTVSDGAITVDVKEIAGSTDNYFGLIWRESHGNYYLFVITASGSWTFAKVTSGSLTSVDSGDLSTITHVEGLYAANSLKVSFQGNHFQFFVNGQLVAKDDDSSLARGQFGMYSDGAGTDIFNNFAYYA